MRVVLGVGSWVCHIQSIISWAARWDIPWAMDRTLMDPSSNRSTKLAEKTNSCRTLTIQDVITHPCNRPTACKGCCSSNSARFQRFCCWRRLSVTWSAFHRCAHTKCSDNFTQPGLAKGHRDLFQGHLPSTYLESLGKVGRMAVKNFSKVIWCCIDRSPFGELYFRPCKVSPKVRDRTEVPWSENEQKFIQTVRERFWTSKYMLSILTLGKSLVGDVVDSFICLWFIKDALCGLPRNRQSWTIIGRRQFSVANDVEGHGN